MPCNPNTWEVEEFNISVGCTVGMMLAWATGDPVSKPTKQVPSRKQLKQQQEGQLESLC